MPDAMTIAVHSMHNDMQRVSAISHNLVNAATPGYRRDIVLARPFASLLATGADAAPAPPDSVLDTSAGTLKSTGRPLDLAVAGDAYIELATPQGPAYSRGGSFHADASGKLVNEAGLPLQGWGGDLILKGEAGLGIDRQGKLSQDGQTLGQIKLVHFTDVRALHKDSTGLLRAAAEAAQPAPAAELRSGQLENSNVVVLREMVSMKEATRHFEAMQKLFQSYDEQMGNAIKSIGEF